MPRFVRIVLQLVIFVLLLSVVIGVASGETGVPEKVALVALGALLSFAASVVRRRGDRAVTNGL
jgi:hypothetical protein